MRKKPSPKRHGRQLTPIAETGGVSCVAVKRPATAGHREAFTYPAFEASEEQLQNMQSLSEILREWVAASRQGYTMELAELYREQARFDESLQVIQTLDEQEVGVTSNLIMRLINGPAGAYALHDVICDRAAKLKAGQWLMKSNMTGSGLHD